MIAILSVPLPPFSPVSYSVIETIGDQSIRGTYNVTIAQIPTGYKLYESRDVGEEGYNVSFTNSSNRFGPGILKYPILFFDPKERLNAIWRLVNRITNNRNGTRGNYSINIEHRTLYIGGKQYSSTYIYVSASRVENATESLEVVYVLLDDLGLTYLIRYKVISSTPYSLALTLIRPKSESYSISIKAPAVLLLIGFASLLFLSRLIVRKYRRSVREIS